MTKINNLISMEEAIKMKEMAKRKKKADSFREYIQTDIQKQR